jgi:hypothetical protein
MVEAVAAALSPALVAATIYGAFDGLRVLRDNAYAHRSRYFWSYLGVPILTLSALAAGLGTAAGAAGWPLGLPSASIGAVSVALLTCAVGVTATRDWCVQTRSAARSARVSLHAEWRVLSVGGTIAGALTLAAVVLTVSLVVIAPPELLRPAGIAALLVHLLLAPGALAFVLRDFGRLRIRRSKRSSGVKTPSLPTAAALPSILLISIDTLRADRLGCYGSSAELTPCLDHDLGIDPRELRDLAATADLDWAQQLVQRDGVHRPPAVVSPTSSAGIYAAMERLGYA